MKRMLKALLLLACLAAALTLTACHTDNDPWPVNDVLPMESTQQSSVTNPPAAEPAQRDAVTQQEAPSAEPATTRVPGGDEAPGFNG
ncbi:MAG: hypothetical protein MRZ54_02000 [Clostridiales bacterium]|nr:hypothetical protein [Clostridiales bacterium]